MFALVLWIAFAIGMDQATCDKPEGCIVKTSYDPAAWLAETSFSKDKWNEDVQKLKDLL